jgi:hypothetical protein
MRRLVYGLGGSGFVEEKRSLVLRDEDRAEVTDRRSPTGQLLRREACALRATLDSGAVRTSDIQLDQEPAHAARRYAHAVRGEIPETLNL